MIKLLVLIGLLVFATPAWGSHNQLECLEEGNLAANIAHARDDGLEIERFYGEVDKLKRATPEMKKIIKHNIKIVYDNPGIDPEMFFRVIYKKCMNHKSKA